jgi:hypothetical protein
VPEANTADRAGIRTHPLDIIGVGAHPGGSSLQAGILGASIAANAARLSLRTRISVIAGLFQRGYVAAKATAAFLRHEFLEACPAQVSSRFSAFRSPCIRPVPVNRDFAAPPLRQAESQAATFAALRE